MGVDVELEVELDVHEEPAAATVDHT